MTGNFKDDAEIIELVRTFETCELNPAEFKHYQHLAVALWYVRNFPFSQASEKMRTGIQKLAATYGKTGYHETITWFWLEMVRDFRASAGDDSICSLANRLTAKYDKESIFEYYSRELLNSPEAKNGWVAPDLKPVAAFSNHELANQHF